ncbi:hypothetical protein N7505_001470 [Penicillium chrysogenum]|jgi:hypothetical protein|uniref:Uncharacterized protein n=1 Tax=Penicillium chrysogenum TaxID=5076 RepID=A0ABQ8WXY4_PENCH|nr:hypothetical protein N7505_001470 [Penicillium chrysogenum]
MAAGAVGTVGLLHWYIRLSQGGQANVQTYDHSGEDVVRRRHYRFQKSHITGSAMECPILIDSVLDYTLRFHLEGGSSDASS